MNQLQAAIEKLEILKAESTPGEWRVADRYSGVTLTTVVGDRPLLDAGDYASSSETFDDPGDAHLIVTLHRTIDAQIAVLRATLDDCGSYGRKPSVFMRQAAASLALADAILGES